MAVTGARWAGRVAAELQGILNLEEMAATWAQDSSSVKVYRSRDGEVDLFGWSKMNDRSKQETAGIDTVQNTRLEFSDYQFHIYETSAWAIFKARWRWSPHP